MNTKLLTPQELAAYYTEEDTTEQGGEPMGERVTVEGTVENVIFHNEENGYTVLLLTVEGEEEPVTVVGCIPVPPPARA